MQNTQDFKNAVEGVISSYEKRIDNIGSLVDVTDLVFGGFQGSILEEKEERQEISTRLRDTLAKNEHLRRKDFDNMMQRILSTQSEREKEIRNLLRQYLDGHKNMALVLRQNIGKFKDALAVGEAERIKEFQSLIKEILDKQENRKKEVTFMLEEFRQSQEELTKRLKELLAKGANIRIRDFKSMLKEFGIQRKRRLALQQKRKKEVVNILGRFKKERRAFYPPKAVNLDE